MSRWDEAGRFCLLSNGLSTTRGEFSKKFFVNILMAFVYFHWNSRHQRKAFRIITVIFVMLRLWLRLLTSVEASCPNPKMEPLPWAGERTCFEGWEQDDCLPFLRSEVCRSGDAAQRPEPWEASMGKGIGPLLLAPNLCHPPTLIISSFLKCRWKSTVDPVPCNFVRSGSIS